MKQTYYKRKIQNLIVVNKIVTIHYFEFDKKFEHQGESHDFWELVYADKESVFCSANGRKIILDEGEMLFHKPNEFHSLSANGETAPNVFIMSFECRSEAMRFFEEKRLKLKKDFLKFIYAIISESRKTFDLPYSDPDLKKMPLRNRPALGGLQLIKNWLEILLIQLIRDETETEETTAAFLSEEEYNNRVADQIVTFLKNHVHEATRIDDVCAALNYNKSYLFRQFKQATGYSIVSYFIGLKINEAKKLLRQTDLTVREISERFAFDSPNYFSKTFKKRTGFTPLQYKKIHRK